MVCNAPTAGFHLLTVQCGPAAPIRLGATLMDVARFHLLAVQCGPAAPIRLGATLMDVARFRLLTVQCGPAARAPRLSEHTQTPLATSARR
jgi:hypothetical protein